MKRLLIPLVALMLAVAVPDASAGFKKKAVVGSLVIKSIVLSKKRYPASAKHIQDAQKAGAPKTLTVDRAGAAERRRAALSGKKTEPGKDRDEYPPAMTKEGGAGASVRSIPKGDNRGAGACIGAQCRDVPDGGKVRVKVTD